MAALSRIGQNTAARLQTARRVKGAQREMGDLALVALGPAIVQLREAANGIEAATFLAEMAPPHLHPFIARYVMQHAANFDGEIVAAVISYVGFEALARVTSENAAEAAFTRFVLPVQNANVA